LNEIATSERLIWNHQDSRLRLQTIVRLRWFGVIGQLLTVAFVYWVLKFDLPVGLCLVFIAASAWVNVFLRIRYPLRHRLDATIATALLAYDIVQLSALLYLTGGVENPFIFLLVAPVTVSAATLPARNTVILGLFALLVAAMLIEYRYPLPWKTDEPFGLPRLYKLGVLASVVAGMTFLALYVARLSKEGRQMSAALAATELVLAREQKLHALDGLAAAAAHELGTPLATIVLVTKELEAQTHKDTALGEDISLLRSQAERCREILRTLTRKPSEADPHHASLPVTQLIQEAAEPYQNLSATVEIRSGPADGSRPGAEREPVLTRQPGLIYGLGNIIENAVDFARETVEIAAQWDDENVVVTIMDDGPGFAPDVFESLGEPYVTTRAAGRQSGNKKEAAGLGLGFFIAKTLLERSGARVSLDNRTAPPTGAIVRVVWPRTLVESPHAGDPISIMPGRSLEERPAHA
jgi:two-component system sensor histidine kinase RegB